MTTDEKHNDDANASDGRQAMDIYSFIRSPEVAEHCRKIGKTWNTLEMAVIIDRSNRTYADKHAAWQELLENYPDMPAMPNYHKVEFDSVHDKIAQRIVYERMVTLQFKKPENGVFYTYRLENWISDSNPFATLENALADLKDSYTQSEAPRFRIERVVVDAGNNSGMKADFDYDENMYDIHAWFDDEFRKKWFHDLPKKDIWDDFDFAGLFFIDIPIPFKRGDILMRNKYGKHGVFILDSAYIVDTPEKHAKYLRGEVGDGVDLNGNGLFVNEAGVLYWDHAGDYDSFVSCERELEGKDRLLYYVALYMADKIPLHILLYMQCRIMMEQTLSNNFRLSTHDCYIPEHMIYENRNK